MTSENQPQLSKISGFWDSTTYDLRCLVHRTIKLSNKKQEGQNDEEVFLVSQFDHDNPVWFRLFIRLTAKRKVFLGMDRFVCDWVYSKKEDIND